MQYRIQTLVFPTDEKHYACRKLFYRGDLGILDKEKNELTIGDAQTCDFVTYLNACSWQKWQRYTKAKKLTLHLEVSGEVRIELVGYHQEALSPARTLFAKQDFSSEDKQLVELEVPENDEQMVGFTITALSSGAKLYGGYFTVEIPEKELNDVTLCIATTTFKKEEFIRKNVAIIKKDLLAAKDDLARDLYLHVIDNGRTLEKADVAGEHMYLHPNTNTGGSGGFARGMIESLHQKPKPTHVLLMDDDVLVLPESIRRTYNLLRMLKPEFSEYFINGAMLFYEDPEKQHEDIGTVDWGGVGHPLKAKLNHSRLENNLKNEQDYPAERGQYGAWWFCCIPTKAIEANGLPLPIFVRADDIEYSIRCKAKFITMNGICVWHMGFETKYSAALVYQGFRNNLMGAAFSETVSNEGMFRLVYDGYRSEMMRFRYGAVEAIVSAFEDFLKGPEFLREPNGEALMGEKAKLTEKLVPLSTIEGFTVGPRAQLQDDRSPSIKTRLYLKLTWNGQRYTRAHKTPRRAVVTFNGVLQPERIVGMDELLAVNPYSMDGVVYKKDRAQFKQLRKRYKLAVKKYKKIAPALIQAYKDARDEMTSEDFWRKYLDLSS